MTRGPGEALRRACVAVVVTFLVGLAAVPGVNRTSVAVDPSLDPAGYALISVRHGTADAVAFAARDAGASDVSALATIDLVTAKLSPSVLHALRADVRINFIAADAEVTEAGRDPHYENDNVKASPANQVLQAEKAWTEATGGGVTVALMDTGVAAHPDLAGSVVARVDFVNDGARSLDPGGHGTFMAGLIAAHGHDFSGVAPDAKIVSLRVLDANGKGHLHAVLGAFDWLLRNRVTYNIGVLNLSLGAPQKASYNRELMAGVVESAWLAGVTVVAAAGNDGPGAGSIAIPGADPFVITVGSLADQGTVTFQDDRESIFSGRGPTKDGFEKPDVLAPGEHVVSLRVPGTSLDREQAWSSAGSYARMTGTSASTALVSGVAALVLSDHARYTPTQVKGALVAGGRRVSGSKTPAADAARSLDTHPARVNVGLHPSNVLISLLASSGALGGGIRWDTVSWEAVSWETISWESVTWESVSWDSVAWESVSWDTALEGSR